MKPILVFYIKTNHLPPCESYRILEDIKERHTKFEGYEYLFIASDENKIECLNPSIIIEEEEKNKIKSNIKRIVKENAHIIGRMPFLSKNMLLIEKY